MIIVFYISRPVPTCTNLPPDDKSLWQENCIISALQDPHCITSQAGLKGNDNSSATTFWPMLQYIAKAEKRELHNSSLYTLSCSILPYIQRDVSMSLEIVFPTIEGSVKSIMLSKRWENCELTMMLMHMQRQMLVVPWKNKQQVPVQITATVNSAPQLNWNLEPGRLVRIDQLELQSKGTLQWTSLKKKITCLFYPGSLCLCGL